MVIHIFKKGRVDASEIGEMEGRVEIDRGTGKVGVARLDVNFR